MADFENYPETAAKISLEIERKLIALGVDWRNDLALRTLAVDIMAAELTSASAVNRYSDANVRQELRGLVAIMLRTMEESAEHGAEVHGSDAWKALARALWATKEFPASSTFRPD